MLPAEIMRPMYPISSTMQGEEPLACLQNVRVSLKWQSRKFFKQTDEVTHTGTADNERCKIPNPSTE